LLTVTDASGTPVRVVTGPVEKGVQPSRGTCARPRINCRRIVHGASWRTFSAIRSSVRTSCPAKYSVTLSQRVGGVVSQLAGPTAFSVAIGPEAGHSTVDLTARWQFDQKLQTLRRDVAGALELSNSTNTRLDAIVKALDATPAVPRTLHDQARALKKRLAAILVELQGDRALASRSEATPVAISERVNTISGELNKPLGRQTQTHEQQLQIASELFVVQRAALKALVETDVPAIERSSIGWARLTRRGGSRGRGPTRVSARASRRTYGSAPTSRYLISTSSIAIRSGPSIIAARDVPHGWISSRNLTFSRFRRVTVASRSAVLSAQ
jgi:hypothetical protein